MVSYIKQQSLGIAQGRDISMKRKEEYMDYKQELAMDSMEGDTIPRDNQHSDYN